MKFTPIGLGQVQVELSSTSSATEALRHFKYFGEYRNQSRIDYRYSELEGRWLEDSCERLTDSVVNDQLRDSHLWLGRARVRLRAAEIYKRIGVFGNCADSLYYRGFFKPAPLSPSMTTDVLDVSKLSAHWSARTPHIRRLIRSNDVFDALFCLVDPVIDAAVNEYMCHEAGHALGWDISAKYEAGYFRPAGVTAWPLIYVEEFRADMHAMGFAVSSLPKEKALGVFAYHILNRFGLAAACAETDSSSSGTVPYLLFQILLNLRFLHVAEDGKVYLPLENTRPEMIMTTMQACANHAARKLTSVDLVAREPIDVAIHAARYFRIRASDGACIQLYRSWMDACRGGTEDGTS